ncbi:MAG: RluA family pseudouridine synthase [Planctomycetes bacterium]|nr:RluA family pseudouridine synthase [Planctomycetota bacterium]
MHRGEFKDLSDTFAKPATVWEDPDILILAKPPGMETVSRTGGRDFTVLAREAFAEPGLTPVHRLDRDTSGAQVFARNAQTETALVALFRRREMEKTYLAVCLGRPRNRTGTIRRRLSEWGGGRRPVRVVHRGGLEAETGYRVLAATAHFAAGGGASLVAFFPHQGRTHQIRVHAAALGYPILGDDQYGDRPANRAARQDLGIRRQALHAWQLAFPHGGGIVRVECPVAADLLPAIGRLFGWDGSDGDRRFGLAEA